MKLFNWLIGNSKEKQRIITCVIAFSNDDASKEIREKELLTVQTKMTPTTKRYLESLTKERSSSIWISASQVRFALGLISAIDYKKLLCSAVTTYDYDSKVKGAKALSQLNDVSLASTFISCIEAIKNSSQHVELTQVCVDALVTIGDAGLPEIIAWWKRTDSPAALTVLSRSRNPLVSKEIKASLEKLKEYVERCKSRHENPEFFIIDKIHSLEKIAKGSSYDLWGDYKARLKEERQRLNKDEWRKNIGRNALTCPECGKPRRVMSLQHGKLHAASNCSGCGFRYT